MKIQKYAGWSNLDIYLIPKIGFKVSIPSILNMNCKFPYREICFSFKFLGFGMLLQINFS